MLRDPRPAAAPPGAGRAGALARRHAHAAGAIRSWALPASHPRAAAADPSAHVACADRGAKGGRPWRPHRADRGGSRRALRTRRRRDPRGPVSCGGRQVRAAPPGTPGCSGPVHRRAGSARTSSRHTGAGCARGRAPGGAGGRLHGRERILRAGVERAYGRARVLCDRLGEAGPLFPTLHGLWAFYLTRGEYPTARPLAERMLLIARQVDDAALRLRAHQALGMNDYYQGKFAAADEHLRQSLALYDPRQHRGHLFLPHDPAVMCLCYRAWALWMLGYPDQALRAIVDAVTLAREIGDASNLVLVLHGEHL